MGVQIAHPALLMPLAVVAVRVKLVTRMVKDLVAMELRPLFLAYQLLMLEEGAAGTI